MESLTATAASRPPDPDLERAWLIRLCHRLTGDPEVAEDLAQETLFRAWQHGHQLRDPKRREAWVRAIARNACRRWLRDRGPAPLRLQPADWEERSDVPVAPEPADDFDLEVELERGELAALLDRALRLLPPEAREVLVERYVEGSPQAETALRLGLSEGAVAMRLQRGKLALRRILVSTFPDEAAAYGLGSAKAGNRRRTTRIWCPWCGRRRLEGVFIGSQGLFCLSCPSCGPLNDTRSASLFSGVSGYRAALTRLLKWVDGLSQRSLCQRTIPCPACGETIILHKGEPDTFAFDEWRYGGPYPGRGPLTAARRLVWYHCRRCGAGTWNGQECNLLALPEARLFWRNHPRVQVLPEREVESAGRSAVVTGFASVTDQARLDIVYARDTLAPIAIHQVGAPDR